ncbi:Protein LSM14 B-B [Blattella germanica]|nr:Protein LSM14 B-B [Blattella germanica]
MSAEMPELGSKISLISKADIRYEGQLFTVDPQESTIALANVRSFGTEDRDAKFPIEPQPQIYDYILFRGSDIKDIKIMNNVRHLNDPAIVQYPTYGAMGAMTGLPSAVAPGMSLHRDPRTLSRQQSELVNPVSVPEPTNKDQGARNVSVLDLISGSPRSVTPSLIARKSPTMDQGVQVNQSVSVPIKEDKKQQAPQSRQVQPIHPARDGQGGRGTIGQQQYHPQPQREPRDRDNRDLQIRDHQPVSDVATKGTEDNEKKDDSGNETGAGEGEQEEDQNQVFYDKSVSFFDNISCEAVERSKGRSQRTDWRTERKLNSETFGVASARRGGYRGRGYYGNRGMGGMYRGGFRGGYRGQGGRGRGNNQSGNMGPTSNNMQPRNIAQQSKKVLF